MATYILATDRPWGERIYHERISNLPGHWQLLNLISELGVTGEIIESQPRYIFFLYWSQKVSSELVRDYECIGFHMANLPDGRGGNPLQNLIVAGQRETVITAFRLDEGMDTGPIYCQEPLSLEGLAEEIYIRAANICAKMIERIITESIQPIPQEAKPEARLFKRRKPEQSEIPACGSLDKLWDHLRMLDADGYPRAFLDYAGYRYTFSRPALRSGHIQADVTITPWGEK